jgi:hypothetical protein
MEKPHKAKEHDDDDDDDQSGHASTKGKEMLEYSCSCS